MEKSIFAKIKKDFLDDAHAIKDLKTLEDLEIKFLGRKGILQDAMKSISSLSDIEKREVGTVANKTKQEIESRLVSIKSEITNKKISEELKKESIDITEPFLPSVRAGHTHPITRMRFELEDWFLGLGFSVLDGPDLESDFFNFEALNIPKYHPARDTQDTFYIEGSDGQVMRTHTSPMQVRGMLKYGAPVRAIVPGRVFRNEATDASHEHTFDQLEGIMVDKDISIAHLIGVIKQVLIGVFRKDIKFRLRPGHFNFVEPGFEMDIACLVCSGAACPVCKYSGWVEIMGCGLIHPRVLEYGKIDPNVYSGFAFGFGLTRLLMMKHGIEDIRLINSGELKFLNQF